MAKNRQNLFTRKLIEDVHNAVQSMRIKAGLLSALVTYCLKGFLVQYKRYS